jgi:hypothetical protein
MCSKYVSLFLSNPERTSIVTNFILLMDTGRQWKRDCKKWGIVTLLDGTNILFVLHAGW